MTKKRPASLRCNHLESVSLETVTKAVLERWPRLYLALVPERSIVRVTQAVLVWKALRSSYGVAEAQQCMAGLRRDQKRLW